MQNINDLAYNSMKCNICDETFTSGKKLKKHKNKHVENRFQCSECNMVFVKENVYKGHMRNRHGMGELRERSFQCDQCDKAYTSNDQLVAHLRKHTGEKPFQCSACDKMFMSKTQLKNHVHVTKHYQLLDKEFKCNQCDKSFGQNRNLEWHMKTHKRKNMYKHH